jgi:hypothetical protein
VNNQPRVVIIGGGFGRLCAARGFPDKLYQAPRSWTEKAYPKLIHYNRLPKGGRLAAWEKPEFFVQEMRAAFKSLR